GFGWLRSGSDRGLDRSLPDGGGEDRRDVHQQPEVIGSERPIAPIAEKIDEPPHSSLVHQGDSQLVSDTEWTHPLVPSLATGEIPAGGHAENSSAARTLGQPGYRVEGISRLF